jgi:MFS family permease
VDRVRQSDQVGAWVVRCLNSTWLTPVEGFIVDSLSADRGPKIMVAFGGVMVAIGWAINAAADSLPMLYLGSGIAGVGGGAVYATSVGLAVKWFPTGAGLRLASPQRATVQVRL